MADLNSSHSIIDYLEKINFSKRANFVPYYPKVRDRDDVSVYRCKATGIFVLSSSEHIQLKHYEDRKELNYWSSQDRRQAVLSTQEDTLRRSHEIKSFVIGKDWLDVGTGAGGILDELGRLASSCRGVEPQEGARAALMADKYEIFRNTKDIPVSSCDFISLFHCLEHVIHPLEFLQDLKNSLRTGGKIWIEVPQARDILFDLYNFEKFKAFSFWSEHLILHTEESLRKTLEYAGFKNIQISYVQRYPLSNHLYWLSHGQPGGHIKWKDQFPDSLSSTYTDFLKKSKRTDTIIALAEI